MQNLIEKNHFLVFLRVKNTKIGYPKNILSPKNIFAPYKLDFEGLEAKN